MGQRTRYCIILLIIVVFPSVSGQKSAAYFYSDQDFRKGIELYEREKYGAARRAFGEIIERAEGNESQLRSEAMYYHAMSAIRLYNLDAEYHAFRFTAENPESPHINDIAFAMGNYFHYKMNWARAIMWYNRVDWQDLSNQERSEFYYKRGYAYYMRKEYREARVDFYEIIDMDTPYTAPATYYYSHIHYEEENYETALNGFRKIDTDPAFRKIAPYYISQILYLQKKYDEVIEYAPPLMETISEKREGEMAKIIGESYFMTERYNEAIPYLETYRKNTRGNSVKDRYQMAFAFYKAGEYEKARDLFEKITYRRSEIAQSALYHLADCYIRMNDKNKAMIAFSQASKMDYDQHIQEDALFNYAKLTFELSYDPFNEAIRAFNQYISYYPSSERIDEAYNYLVLAYMQTQNFSLALESLEKIKFRDAAIERAYQKVAFYRGLELYNNLRFIEAVDILERSLEFGKYDDRIRARTYYWLGEAAYRGDDLLMAKTYYSEFLDEEFAHMIEEYPLAHYSMGYIAFNEEQYSDAERWFQTYTKLEKNEREQSLSDAYNRLGDCKFVQKDYWRAIEYYNESIRMGRSDRDYAYFQKGFTYGILNRPEQKLEVMLDIQQDMPESPYIDDAKFETGRTLLALGRSREAVKAYMMLVEDHPNSSYLSKTLNQLGLIYFNDAVYDSAMEYYTRVVMDYPGTPEADNALQSLESIYLKNSNIEEYLAFVNGLGRDLSNKQQDSLMYVSAENAYTAGNCEKAIEAMENYIAKHSDGNYLLNANYYLADCHLKAGKPDEAIAYLDYIASQPRNMFSEPALIVSGRIHFGKENYNVAVNQYIKLIAIANDVQNISEARIGIMRCYYRLEEYANVTGAANDVLAMEKLPEEIRREAWYKMAKSYFALNEKERAFEYFSKNADYVNSEEGAESKYMVAKMKYDRALASSETDPEAFREVENEIYDFIEKNTPHQYWMGKAFLLLSDVYLMLNDEFQAIHTLKSVIDYYSIPDDGIIEEAKKRHDSLTAEADEDVEFPEENEDQQYE
ncbi:MAG: tetratricopeptide repeat protein [Bacteroidales bacterium]|nr:tetratricopeptide repeat protein [Bacteroidales bacterium]